MVDMDVEFIDEDGNFDQGKYDAFRDIVKESYAQQMKCLRRNVVALAQQHLVQRINPAI